MLTTEKTSVILAEVVAEEAKESREKSAFSFKWLAKQIIERQTHDKDMVIAIVGERRNGKTNWGLRLVLAFIREKKKADPLYKWTWRDNFILTPTEAPKKIERIPDCSFCFFDEAGDVAFKGDSITRKSKSLVKFMNKSGKKRLLTIWIIPDIYQLNRKILNMCSFLVIVPYRYKDVAAAAFIIGRTPNALTDDKFGLERIQRFLKSKKAPIAIFNPSLDGRATIMRDGQDFKIPYPKDLFKFYRSLMGFKHYHWFGCADKKFEGRYMVNVKDKQLLAHEAQEKYVQKIWFDKVRKTYELLLYNLHRKEKQGLTYQQILNLHINGDGEYITNIENIRKRINIAAARFEHDRGDIGNVEGQGLRNRTD